MNQNSAYLKPMYHFIQFLWGISIFVGIFLLVNILSNSHNVRPPVNFKVSKAGEVVQSQTFPFTIERAYGHISYPEGYQPPTLDLLIYHGSEIIEFLLSLFILFQIKTMTKQTLTGHTFNTRNSQRLQWIGWTILVLGLFSYIESIYSHYHFDGTLFVESITDWKDKSKAYQSGYWLGRAFRFLNSPFLWAGLSTLVLSLVFKEGTTLKEEVDLTI